MLLLLLSAPAPAACRRAWKLTRTLAEGAALLLAGAWRRSPADLQTSFVPLAGAALERQVGGEGVEGRCCLLRDELLRPCTLMVSMCCCSCAALPQEAVAVLGRMMALTGCDDDLGRLVVPLLRCHFFCTESEAYRQQVFYYRWVGAAPVCWCNVLMCRCVGAGQRMCTACVPEGAVCGACLEQM